MLGAIYRSIGSSLSPAGPRARLTILIYHRILDEVDPIFPFEATAQVFDAQMAALKSVFNALPLPEAVTRLKQGTLPARAACITFDDGYADNHRLALPILRKHGLHATFFIATAYLNGGRMFNDTVIEAIRRTRTEHIDLRPLGLGEHDVSSAAAKAAAIGHILTMVKCLPTARREQVVAELASRVTDAPLPDDLMMTTDQLRALHAAGMEIGGHTHHHPILTGLDDAQVRAEIVAGNRWLEQALGTRVRLFAYPNGRPDKDYRREQARVVEALGLEGAVSTQCGVSTRHSDPYQLARCSLAWSPLSRFVPMLLNNLRKAV